MKDSFENKDGKIVVEQLIATIHSNRQYLSDIDGEIGDGDHGINMDKGFTLCEEAIKDKEMDLSEGLKTLGTILLTEIGGSMGPLYGSLFRGMAKACKQESTITKEVFARMLETGLAKVVDIGSAKVGDKTLVDTLDPAVTAFKKPGSFQESLQAMDDAAKKGWQSTKDMVAKLGRASRLGERSRGVLDAGATSCYVILHSMGESIQGLLK
jgi:dihydroxyacetone kinase-like protein